MAGADAAPSVVDAALDALQPVVQNLWREAGTQSNDRHADPLSPEPAHCCVHTTETGKADGRGPRLAGIMVVADHGFSVCPGPFLLPGCTMLPVDIFLLRTALLNLVTAEQGALFQHFPLASAAPAMTTCTPLGNA